MNARAAIQWGDLGAVAAHYASRPTYAEPVIDCLTRYTGSTREGYAIADIGAGTGKLTAMLADRGLSGFAIEPSEGMLAERPRAGPAAERFDWRHGRAEESGLANSSVDWVCMGTAFHWTDPALALLEFHRVLRRNGHFTAIWDLNDPHEDALMREVEELIEAAAPGLRRVQANIYRMFETIEEILLQSGRFADCLRVEAAHTQAMTPERYVAMWRSYHDVPSQIGQKRWDVILDEIGRRIAGKDMVAAAYRSHSWTVRAV